MSDTIVKIKINDKVHIELGHKGSNDREMVKIFVGDDLQGTGLFLETIKKILTVIEGKKEALEILFGKENV